MNMPLALLNRRRRIGGFSPNALFALAEPGVWFDPSDLTTLFQDTAGTTLVTTPGQPVGLMLDKSRGLALGPELVTNGDFSVGTTGWSASGSASLSVVSGALRVANGAAVTGGASQTFNTVAGTTYRWTYYVDPATSGGAVVRVRDGGTLTVISTATRTVAGAYTLLFVATGSTTQINCVNSSSTAGVYHDVDNISVKELPGNHAVQATGANRPNYGIEPQGGRRNLLVRTEEFENASWTLSNLLAFGSGSTANATAAPNGTTTADLVTENLATNAHSIFGTGFSVTSGVSYAISVYVKDNGRRYISIRGQNAISPANYPWATFDLTNVASVRNAAASNSLIESVGSGWYRCTLVWTADSTVTGGNAVIALSNVSTAPAISNTLGNSYTGNGTSGIYLWGAQWEVSAWSHSVPIG